jgi:hypothetical protein
MISLFAALLIFLGYHMKVDGMDRASSTFGRDEKYIA